MLFAYTQPDGAVKVADMARNCLATNTCEVQSLSVSVMLAVASDVVGASATVLRTRLLPDFVELIAALLVLEATLHSAPASVVTAMFCVSDA